MSKDYKNVISNKRKEAANLMTEKQIGQCNTAIHIASAAAGTAGAIPIPIADAIPISAAQISMVVALGKVFDQKITESAAKGAIAAAASTFVGRTFVKIIPIAGWIVSAAVAAGVTEAIGWTIAVDMAKKSKMEKKLKTKNEEDTANAWAEEFYEQSDDFDEETDDSDEATDDYS